MMCLLGWELLDMVLLSIQWLSVWMASRTRLVLPRGNPEVHSRTIGRRVHLVVKRSISTLGDRSIDNEDPPEPLGSGSSSDDEANVQSLKLAIPEIKKQTLADQFQEALGVACLNDKGALFAAPKPLGIGLFGKLQQVMQNEKERDANFLKKLQTGSYSKWYKSYDEASFIDVKILSRYLDAKLTVCHCAPGKNKESSQWPESPQTTRENGGRKITIIFNSRVCGDVELEVGNLIRIHPPWKEVQVTGNDERGHWSSPYPSKSSLTMQVIGDDFGVTNQVDVLVTAYPAHTVATSSYPLEASTVEAYPRIAGGYLPAAGYSPTGYPQPTPPPAGYPLPAQLPAGYPTPALVGEYRYPFYGVNIPPRLAPAGQEYPQPAPGYGYTQVQEQEISLSWNLGLHWSESLLDC
ncbi:hypothetical protein L1049_005376 [Liquidambar formosana]|uniref:Galectin n=1 Tax=Liquidambar formosana TaxID=63359 RepID=A0AAP0X1E7_LIQFO